MQQDRHIIRNNIAVPRIVIVVSMNWFIRKQEYASAKEKTHNAEGMRSSCYVSYSPYQWPVTSPLPSDLKMMTFPCILVTSHVWACTDSHLTVKSQPTYLFLEPFNQSRSTNTTPFVPASMAANKDIGPVDSLRRSRKPLSILHKYFFNKVVDVKMSQTSASIMLQIEK